MSRATGSLIRAWHELLAMEWDMLFTSDLRPNIQDKFKLAEISLKTVVGNSRELMTNLDDISSPGKKKRAWQSLKCLGLTKD